MARRDTKPAGPNALLASGKKLRLGTPGVRLDLGLTQAWQADAWDYWRKVPEVKQLMLFLGNQLAKLRLFLAIDDPDDPEADPIPIGSDDSGVPDRIVAAAQAELDRLGLHDGGIPELLRRLDLNLEIPGEGYLIGLGAREVGDPDPFAPMEGILITDEAGPKAEEWWVVSRAALLVAGQGDASRTAIRLHPGDDKGRRLDKTFDTIIRIHQADPEWPALADSAMQGVLFECRIVLALTAQVLAVANSQMHAGILTVPNELSFGPAQPTDNDDLNAPSEDPLDMELDAVFSEVVKHPDSLMTIRPTLLRGPGQYLSDQFVRYIQLGRELDERLDSQIEQRVRRIARGLNAPVEAIEGHMSTTFANAKQIDRDLFDDHVEPRATMLVRSLTSGYLQPNLKDAASVEDPETGATAVVDEELAGWADRIRIWYDASSIIREPDPEEHAQAAHAARAISDGAYRQATGFGEDDAPDALELIIRTALGRGTLDPVITVALLQQIAAEAGVELPDVGDLTGQGAAGQPEQTTRIATAALLLQQRIRQGNGALPSSMPLLLPAELTTTGSVEVAGPNPGAGLLAIDVDLRTRLLVAASDAMERALERAGNRLRSKVASSQRPLIDGMPPRRFAEILGRGFVAAAGLTENDLVGDDPWAGLADLFNTWTLAAQRAALDELEGMTGAPLPNRADLEARQDDDRSTAWGWLAAALSALLARRIFNPNPAAPEVGEHDTTMSVPTGLIVAAMAQAGGAPRMELDIEDLHSIGAVVADGGTRPVGGIGTGELMVEQFRDYGIETRGYRWVYGHALRATFHPHLSLDGIVYENYDDPRLINGAGWPPFGFYFPSDHLGCRCNAEPILIPPAR